MWIIIFFLTLYNFLCLIDRSAEDVLLETFLNAYLHLDSLRNNTSEKAWIYCIATNEAIRWIQQNHSMTSLDEVDEKA